MNSAQERACKAAFSHHLTGSSPNHEETDMAEANQRLQQPPTEVSSTSRRCIAYASDWSAL
jgi:hypothetical protein